MRTAINELVRTQNPVRATSCGFESHLRHIEKFLWGSFHLLSVAVAIGGAWLVSYFVQGFLTWPLGGFVATSVYLLVAGSEATAAYEWDHRKEG